MSDDRPKTPRPLPSVYLIVHPEELRCAGAPIVVAVEFAISGARAGGIDATSASISDATRANVSADTITCFAGYAFLPIPSLPLTSIISGSALEEGVARDARRDSYTPLPRRR